MRRTCKTYWFTTALALLFHAVGLNGTCQSLTHSFEHINVDNGLSQRTVFAIAQDQEGFMWFGTRNGLNRYDSRKIIAYTHKELDDQTLSDNTIYSICSDSHGHLWVGTSVGLNRYLPDSDTFTEILYSDSDPSSLSENTITCILEDRHHRIWCGTRRGLNLMVSEDPVRFERFLADPGDDHVLKNDHIRCMFEDTDGDLWLGTSDGFAKLTYRSTDDFDITSYSAPFMEAGGPLYMVNAFAQVDSGKLLVGSEQNGLALFEKKTERFLPIPLNNDEINARAIRAITKDSRNHFLIGTMGGLFTLNGDLQVEGWFRNIPDDASSISDNSVRSIFLDQDGTVWLGTFHGGINLYNPLSTQFKFMRPGTGRLKLPFKVASAIVKDFQNNIWMGTEGDGLLTIDAGGNNVRSFKHEINKQRSLNHDNIKCLIPEKTGLWIGTVKGLDYYQPEREAFLHLSGGGRILPEDGIYDMVMDAKGTLWAGTYTNGLFRIDPKHHKILAHYQQGNDSSSITNNGVTSLYIDSNETLWIGTASGLNRMNSGSSVFMQYTSDPSNPSSLSGGHIECIYEDTKHRLWVGTRIDGLSLLSGDGQEFQRISREDGLPGNSVYGILEDSDGNLWISTERGLSQFNPDAFTFRNFNHDDGLICNEFNHNSYYVDPSGYMYFGGYDGVVYFHPDSIHRNHTIPAVVLTGLRLFNKEYKPASDKGITRELRFVDEVELYYNQDVFSIEFAVLNYINPDKNQFAYRLEGFENEWNYVNDPVATYMNLQPGEYTLLVNGSNNDGVWSEEPVALRLAILPPPWKTWWAYTAYVAIFLALLYTWSRFSKRQIKLEHDLQLEHMEKLKQEELHQAKINFFTNIAHEIRTPLTLIVGPIEQMLDRKRLDTFFRNELNLVKANTNRLLRLINQLLDFQRQDASNASLNVTSENIVTLVHEILHSFEEFASTRNVLLHFESVSDRVELWFDRDELSKVFCNLLINAFRFTPGGGRIAISIRHEECADNEDGQPQHVRITVEDNGLGIPSQHLKNVFDRFYQAEHAGIKEEGFGIGLALTKSIIDLHHGEIFVESSEATSEIPGFTRFTILLPVGRSHFEELLHTANGRPGDMELLTMTPLPGNEKLEVEPKTTEDKEEKHLILVVEDNPDVRCYVSNLLEGNGYRVVQSDNGRHGWEVATEQLPDLIVSDIIMPSMSGLDLLRKIKDDLRTNHIPVMLLTARGSVSNQVEGIDTGADDYIAKPFNHHLLLAKIRNHLSIREKLKAKYSRIVTLEPKDEELLNGEDQFLNKLIRILHENIADPAFNVTGLCRAIGMSRPVLFRKIKMMTGMSVIDLIRSVRMKKAEMLLKQRTLTISEVAFAVGFSDPKYFSKTFREQFHKSPSQYLEELVAE